MSTDVNQGLNSEVGTTLRRRREALDLELTHVARTLRIRREYLAALENNTLVGLPGPAYALGFLRTYSEYLGLDGVDMVRRYKATTDALNDKPNLTFPMPLTERGVPGGGLFLLTTIVLIGLGYGTWYYISSGQHPTLATVEPVPAQLAAIAPPPAPPVATPAASGKPGTPMPAPTVPNMATPSLPTSSGPAPQPEAAPVVTQPAPATTANSPAAMPTGMPQNGGTATPSAIDGGPSNAPAMASAAPIASDPGQGVIGDGQPAQTPAAQAVSTAPGPNGHVYGQPKPARVVARATAKSWIQVSDASGKVLTTRVMQDGDTYNAPDEKGLAMWTGNVGALQFIVDGRPQQPAGKFGEARKHLSLDPSNLSHGSIQ